MHSVWSFVWQHFVQLSFSVYSCRQKKAGVFVRIGGSAIGAVYDGWDVDAHVLKQLVWVRCKQHGNLSTINCPFAMVSKQKWHVSSRSAGWLNMPNSAMIVGDKTSPASARVPTCSVFSD